MSVRNPYGTIADAAGRRLRADPALESDEVWDEVAKTICTGSPSSRDKRCPKSAFAGLRYLFGATPKRGRNPNGDYADAGYRLLCERPELASLRPRQLWDQLKASGTLLPRNHNGHMNVVLAVYRLLNTGENARPQPG